MDVRVRFAPSPTGYLHIGGARTALFNYLCARQNEGSFFVRIEDTDFKRSSEEMVQGILEGLSWLGLEWDGAPVVQSQRLDSYRGIARRLVEQGDAYRCFLSEEQLEESRASAREKGDDWRFDPRSRAMDPQEAERRAEAGQAHVVRFKVEDGRTIRFKDRVYGKVVVESGRIEDFVILKSDGRPTYHLAVVADDADMGITHVIRGVDHLGNTAKHILLYIALGEKVPKYVHLPLILGPDRKRLSKRHGATSVMEYRKRGFPAAAVRNYLALLGWSPKGNEEVFPGDELVEAFELSRINKADAVFDIQKLEWMSGQYISAMSARELAPHVRRALEEEGIWREAFADGERRRFLEAIELLKPRMRRYGHFASLGRAYFSGDFEYDQEAAEQYLRPDDPGKLKQALEELRSRYAGLEEFTLESTEQALRDVCDERGVKAGALIGAVRVALTGQKVAPGIFEVIVHMGRERVDRRLGRAAGYLGETSG